MKIVRKKGEKPLFNGSCKICKTDFTYDFDDIQSEPIPYTIETFEFVTCPTCNKNVTHDEGNIIKES